MSNALLPVYFVDYVVDLARPGASGLSDVVWDMAEELVRQGGEAHVFGPYGVSPRPESGVTLHRFRIPPPGYRNAIGHVAMVLSAWYEIRRLRRSGIIHAPEYVSTAILACLSRYPVVLTVPGNVFERLSRGVHAFDPYFTVVLCVAARVSAWRCARVVATSRQMELWWAWTGVNPNRLRLVPYGIDTKRFRRVPDARSSLGISPESVVVLNVGRLNAENGHDCLVRAFATVAHEFPTAQLHMVGSGPEEAGLRALADRLGIAGRIRWHGWVDQKRLPNLYSAADLFLFTALSAGMPRVVYEAMSCGAPTLASMVPGVTDHIEAGENGYLSSPGDAEALSRRLREALSDPKRDEKGARGASYVNEQLSWGAVMRELIKEVYDPLSAHLR